VEQDGQDAWEWAGIAPCGSRATVADGVVCSAAIALAFLGAVITVRPVA